MQNEIKYLIYTEEVGGDFHAIAMPTNKETQDLYEKTLKTGILQYSIVEGGRFVKIKPVYLAICTAKEDYDFVLKRSPLNPEEEEDGTE